MARNDMNDIFKHLNKTFAGTTKTSDAGLSKTAAPSDFEPDENEEAEMYYRMTEDEFGKDVANLGELMRPKSKAKAPVEDSDTFEDETEEVAETVSESSPYADFDPDEQYAIASDVLDGLAKIASELNTVNPAGANLVKGAIEVITTKLNK